MDGRLALYSGAVFAGVLLAGALVIKPGVGDSSGAVTTGDPNSANTSTGQSGDNRGFVSRLTSFVRGDDDDDDEYEDDEHERYEHGDDDHEDDD